MKVEAAHAVGAVVLTAVVTGYMGMMYHTSSAAYLGHTLQPHAGLADLAAGGGGNPGLGQPREAYTVVGAAAVGGEAGGAGNAGAQPDVAFENRLLRAGLVSVRVVER